MKYYVNVDAREDGTHIVHAESCQYLPNQENRKALGDYANCETALRHARDAYDKVNGCRTCATECHEG